jgi:hypothetical protein
MNVTIEAMVQRWSGMERPLFRGKLIDTDGCKCAQGDVLSCAGFTDDELREMTEYNADKEVARILGISRTHAVLLRKVNDKVGGSPQIVLSNPEQIIGDKSQLLLAFWLYLDQMTPAAWEAAQDAAWASSEIQGMDILEANGKSPYSLTFFGLNTWDDVRALIK